MRFGESTYLNYLGQVESYKDGDIIFEEGTAGSWVYVIAHGEVEIYKTIKGRKVTLDRLPEGEVFGEVSFFDQRVRSAGARAVGEVGVMLFDTEFLENEYNKMPNCLKVILEAMALRLRRMSNKISKLAADPKLLAKVAAASQAKNKQ